MRPVQFGVFLSAQVTELSRLRRTVQLVEASSFDYVSIQDHPYAPGLPDTLSLIAALSAETARLRFMTNVANLAMRPAPMLAKASATIDLLSAGRFELGLGSGRAWDQIAGLGGPRWSPPEAVAATREAIDVLRALWQPGGPVTYPGRHFPLEHAQRGPVPAHRIGICLGAGGPVMLDLLGTSADGWIAPLATSFESKPPAQDRIDAAARTAGREPTDIRRVIQLVGSVTDVGAQQTRSRPMSGPNAQPIRATPQRWAQIVTEFVTEERFDTVNLVFEVDSDEQRAWFADEVIPRVHAATGGAA